MGQRRRIERANANDANVEWFYIISVRGGDTSRALDSIPDVGAWLEENMKPTSMRAVIERHSRVATHLKLQQAKKQLEHSLRHVEKLKQTISVLEGNGSEEPDPGEVARPAL